MFFFLIKPVETKAFGNSPFYLEIAPCPGGGFYERCWEYCGICYCDPAAQTTCGSGGEQ